MNDARKRAIQEMRDFYPHQLLGSGDEFVASHLPGMVLFAERAIRAEDALAEAVRLLEERKAKEIYDSECVQLEWSDRREVYHPSEFWSAVLYCSLDHSYDRVNDGIPYGSCGDGIPDELEIAFRPIIEKHLSAVEPEWKEKTVYMNEEQRDAFKEELRQANDAFLAQRGKIGGK